MVEQNTAYLHRLVHGLSGDDAGGLHFGTRAVLPKKKEKKRIGGSKESKPRQRRTSSRGGERPSGGRGHDETGRQKNTRAPSFTFTGGSTDSISVQLPERVNLCRIFSESVRAHFLGVVRGPAASVSNQYLANRVLIREKCPPCKGYIVSLSFLLLCVVTSFIMESRRHLPTE